MFYIHQSSCISPQQSFQNENLEILHDQVDDKLNAIEPGYENIPAGILRRMGKAVRMGVGAALPLVKQSSKIDGIIIGTAKGGMEDCIKFLNQIIQYEEGMLTPGNFVQSTPNAIAAQVGLLTSNKGYNITHVHRGLAFENALIDAMMMLEDFPQNTYLLGAVDEISSYNYNIEALGGWYKRNNALAKKLYEYNSPGSIAGEGASMFIVSNKNAENAICMQAISTIHSSDETTIKKHLRDFLGDNLLAGEKIDLVITGENGDSRFLKFYNNCETELNENAGILRFKHMSGEYATASSIALWLACRILQTQEIPSHMIKRTSSTKELKRILIYNNYKGIQHSFMIISKN